jgi:hypothetical protein
MTLEQPWSARSLESPADAYERNVLPAPRCNACALETHRLVIRPFTTDDLDAFAGLMDASFVRPTERAEDLNAHREWLSFLRRPTRWPTTSVNLRRDEQSRP